MAEAFLEKMQDIVPWTACHTMLIVFLLNRIGSAMSQREGKYLLSGIVELDDTYFGRPKILASLSN